MLDAISSVVSAVAAQSVTAKDEAQTKNTNTASKKQDAQTDKSDSKTLGFSEEAAVYEKSDSKDDSKDTAKSTAKSTVNQKMSKADRDALVQALKDDANARQQQLIEIVRKSMTGQASSWDKSQGLKSLFENLTVDADTIAQAKKDIAEDGYWGVEKTSDRILDFAKALSGGDKDKADELLNAFKKGFSQATGEWGDKLPSICQDTYDAVVKKFEAWKNGTDDTQVQG